MLSTAFSSTAPAAPRSAIFRRTSLWTPLVARLKPAGPRAPAWKLQLPHIGAPKPNISLSTWATGHAQRIARSKDLGPSQIRWDRLSSPTLPSSSTRASSAPASTTNLVHEMAVPYHGHRRGGRLPQPERQRREEHQRETPLATMLALAWTIHELRGNFERLGCAIGP